ncbi:hypothetical protein FA95DRAFT_631481 [Auriscalpium vulgare]|uniref:Uncharacterized protein n=1 Tax=Auriscalpium vulgare TaxID=40419 RepID=A0ACB8RD97_9AGAM|nr:hypothetical protein FA95DRAFT_631481 [Auriscalpium vulgare]
MHANPPKQTCQTPLGARDTSEPTSPSSPSRSGPVSMQCGVCLLSSSSERTSVTRRRQWDVLMQALTFSPIRGQSSFRYAARRAGGARCAQKHSKRKGARRQCRQRTRPWARLAAAGICLCHASSTLRARAEHQRMHHFRTTMATSMCRALPNPYITGFAVAGPCHLLPGRVSKPLFSDWLSSPGRGLPGVIG